MSFKIIGSTMGQSTPATVAEDTGSYHWRKHPDWYPGNPAYRENAAACQLAGAAARTERRERRIAEFAAAIAGLGEPDPWEVTNTAVIAAGRIVGVGEKTAMGYRTELRKRQPQGNPS